MSTPSVYAQGVPAFAVPAWSLVPSPRNYNASIVEYEGRRLMAYRSHRMDQGGRCGLVLAEFGPEKAAAGPWVVQTNQWLNLPEQIHSVTVHHEDPRLFVYRGRVHVAFTESVFHPAPRPYTCVMKYARLREGRKGWVVERVFWPRYGVNDGAHQEKNWQFFERAGRLHVVYRGEPHTVLELAEDGERVHEVHVAPPGVRWPWGTIRGGTPPVRVQRGPWAGHCLTFFHSATPYPVAPHWRRYYAGAYVFEPEPPFAIRAISQKPLLTGSEADGHGYDPRNIDSWKPFVVFPSGVIAQEERETRKTGKTGKTGRRGRTRDGEDGEERETGGAPEGWWVSYGVNDHTIAVVEHADLALGDPGFADWGRRYFFTENGGAPVRVFVEEDKPPRFVRWERARGGVAGQCYGVLAVTDPRLYLQLKEGEGAEEIDAAEYGRRKA